MHIIWSDRKSKNPYILHELYGVFSVEHFEPVKLVATEAQQGGDNERLSTQCRLEAHVKLKFLCFIFSFSEFTVIFFWEFTFTMLFPLILHSNFGAANFFHSNFLLQEHPKGAIKICANFTRC